MGDDATVGDDAIVGDDAARVVIGKIIVET